MMEHEKWFAHGYFVYEPIIRVPLMLRGPGVRPGRSDALVSGVDIAATILRFAGRTEAEFADGRSLRSPASKTPRVVWSEGGVLDVYRAAVSSQGKWLVMSNRNDPTGALVRSYIDLEDDPEESARADWASSPAYGRAWLNEQIDADPHPGGIPTAFANGRALDAPKVAPRISDSDRERLRALGYVQ
jgi:arylsulfatase A-like enzyme